eukprot:CFRG8368T1
MYHEELLLLSQPVRFVTLQASCHEFEYFLLGTWNLWDRNRGVICSSGATVEAAYKLEHPYDVMNPFSPGMPMVLTVAFAFGMSIMVLVYGISHISGGHLNPAVTMAMVVFGQMNPIRGVIYIILQTLGATFGVFLVWCMWPTAAGHAVNYGSNGLIPTLNVIQGFFLEFCGTALVGFTVFNTDVDPRGAVKVSNMAPAAIGLSVFLANIVLIPMTGCGINPARSFATAFISGNWNHHLIFWLAPLLGGPCGAALNFIPYRFVSMRDEEVRRIARNVENPGGAGHAATYGAI